MPRVDLDVSATIENLTPMDFRVTSHPNRILRTFEQVVQCPLKFERRNRNHFQDVPTSPARQTVIVAGHVIQFYNRIT
jgi:hypothetical protein